VGGSGSTCFGSHDAQRDKDPSTAGKGEANGSRGCWQRAACGFESSIVSIAELWRQRRGFRVRKRREQLEMGVSGMARQRHRAHEMEAMASEDGVGVGGRCFHAVRPR
jgi:hypothetical protein